jgi:hypothetical protein
MQGIRDCAWVEQRSSHARKLLLCIRNRTVGMGDEDRGWHWQSCDSATIRAEQLGVDVPQISPNKNQPEHMHKPSFSDRQRDPDDFVTPMGSPNPIWCSRSTHNSSSRLLIPPVMEDGEFRPQPFRQPASKWATEPG